MRNHNKLLLHACDTVPYYRALGISIDLNAPFEHNLKKFPILKRSDLCGNESNFISNIYNKSELFYEHTSGSSGSSIKCYKSFNEKVNAGLTLWRHRCLKGISPASKCVSFYTKKKNEDQYKINEGVLLFNNELSLNVLNLCDEQLKIYVMEILKFQPDWIIGPISALFYLARYIDKTFPNTVPFPTLKYVESAGEVSSKNQRDFVSKVLKTNIDDMYGCREIWLIGYRETNGFFKTTTNNAHVEILSTNEKNNYNDLIITGLNSMAMPIIRYKVGDSGFYLTELQSSQEEYYDITCARTNQYLEYKNKTLSVTAFFMAVYQLNQMFPHTIQKFQFVRKSENKFDFLFIPDSDFCEKNIEFLKNILKEVLDNDIELNFIKKQYIEFSNNGKLSFYNDNRDE